MSSISRSARMMRDYTAAAVSDSDYSALNTTLTFAPGSGDGEELCTSVSATSDDLVESEEYFIINLALVTQAGTSFSLGNMETAVVITDNEGLLTPCMQDFMSLNCLSFLFNHSCMVRDALHDSHCREQSNICGVFFLNYDSTISNPSYRCYTNHVNNRWNR